MRVATMIVGAAAFLLLAGPISVSRALADDSTICANESGDVAIAACTRAIKSGRYKGHSLATKYVNRGVEWKLKKDYGRALADYNEAIRLDAKYADAFYNRCSLYVAQNEYDRAIPSCDKAVRLGPSADALAASGGTRLGNDRTYSDYFSMRGVAYHGKKEYDRSIVDFDRALKLYPSHATAIKYRADAIAKIGQK